MYINTDSCALLDWPRSGPVWTVAFFRDRIKRLDCTVQLFRTAVRSQKYWTGPYSPGLLDCSPVRSEKKLDRTVLSGIRLNRSYAYMPHSEILERLIILILHFIPNTGSIALNNPHVSPNVLIY